MGSHSTLQGIFLTQGSNPGLLHCRQILYRLSHQGSPERSKEVADVGRGWGGSGHHSRGGGERVRAGAGRGGGIRPGVRGEAGGGKDSE